METRGGYVSLSMRDLLLDYLECHQIDALALLGKAPSFIEGQVARYPVANFSNDLRKAAEVLGSETVGLDAGQTILPRHAGVLGFVARHSGQLAQALLRLERYSRLVYDGNVMSVSSKGDETTLSWGYQHGRAGQQVDAFLMAALVTQVRQMAGVDLPVNSISFVNPKPATVSRYEEFFRCRVQFDADHTSIGLKSSYLLLPVPNPNTELCAELDEQARQMLAGLPIMSNVEADVRNVLPALIRTDSANLVNVAEKMCCSERTLQRRLRLEGVKFQDVLDKSRLELAQYYLRKPELDVTEVALLCGYAEHSAFTRAFTRWTEYSPSEYRKHLHLSF